MKKILEEIRDMKRFTEIISVLIKQGLYKYINKSKIHELIKLKPTKETQIETSELPKKIRETFQILGTTFIKFGQVLSTRDDIIPKTYADEFKKLLEHNPQVPFSKIKEILEEELKKPINQVFKKVEKEPLSTASIAQVHKATLLNGSVVALKIQKPGVKSRILSDINIIFLLAKILSKHNKLIKNFNLENIVKEFSVSIERELDFYIEQNSLIQIKNNFKKNEILMPKPYTELSTKKVLVMSFLNGENILEHDFKSIKRRILFGETMVKMYCKMIFIDGIFHADPHPGNIFVGKNEMPLFLDFGMVGILEKQAKEDFMDVFRFITEHDTDKTIKALKKIAKKTKETNEPKFVSDVKIILHGWYGQPIEKASFVKAIYDFLQAGAKNGFVFRPEVSLIVKAFIELEGMALKVCPQINMEKTLREYISNEISKRYSPEKIFDESLKTLKENSDLYTKLPTYIAKYIEKFKKGDLELTINKEEFEEHERNKTYFNDLRLYLIIFSAFLIAGSILLNSDKTLFSINIAYYFFVIASLQLLLYYKKKKQKLINNNNPK